MLKELHLCFLHFLDSGNRQKTPPQNRVGKKKPRPPPPQSCAQWSERVLIFFHRGDGRRYLQRLLRHPFSVMRTQSFTISKADEPGAVIDLLRKLLGWLCSFYLCQQGKPSAQTITASCINHH